MLDQSNQTVMLVLKVLAFLCTPLYASASQDSVAGVRYELKVATKTLNADTPTNLRLARPDSSDSFVARVETVIGRGRIDFQEGRPSFLNPGDYILFDSVDMVVVRPSSRQFSIIDTTVADWAAAMIQRAGVSYEQRLTRESVEVVPGLDTLEGRPTRQIRSSTEHSFTIGIDGIPREEFEQAIGSRRATTTYWIADSGPIPNSPFSGVDKRTAMAVDSLAQGISPNVVVLRRVSATEQVTNHFARSVEETVEVSGIAEGLVARDRVIVPSSFSLMIMPGGPDANTPEARSRAEYWQRRP